MEEVIDAGLSRTIGISNFEISHIQELLSYARIKPVVNQIELHPCIYQTQKPLIEFCKQHGIGIQAYSPLGSSKGVQYLMNQIDVISIAKQHNKTCAQVLIKWCVQHGFEAIVKSEKQERLLENALGADSSWSLSSSDMQLLDTVEQRTGTQRWCWNPKTIA